ncbi:hypothetical protein H4R34_000889 [Dimargaris verticillata]|uniref:Uncharacterized protein n=1 Tax=Dimargaris verticillata TaxID=2761393 RepID=A0A9W8BCG6_9FUNG|nr:hypothetical protein H4R34_000889 [Dimargaris verticillata]
MTKATDSTAESETHPQQSLVPGGYPQDSLASSAQTSLPNFLWSSVFDPVVWAWDASGKLLPPASSVRPPQSPTLPGAYPNSSATEPLTQSEAPTPPSSTGSIKLDVNFGSETPNTHALAHLITLYGEKQCVHHKTLISMYRRLVDDLIQNVVHPTRPYLTKYDPYRLVGMIKAIKPFPIATQHPLYSVFADLKAARCEF